MTKDELVEKCAREAHGVLSRANVIAYLDMPIDTAADLARAALAIAMPAAFEMAAKVAEKVIIDARTGEIDNDLRSVSYTLVQEMRAEGEKWK